MIEQLNPDDIIYVDESGIDQYLQRDYARSRRGKQVICDKKGNRYQRISIVAGKCGKKILAPMMYAGTADKLLFESWVEEALVPELTPGKVIVMDNYSIHKSKKTQELIESKGCKILFQPPYSPDLNLIERFWGWMKNQIRNIKDRFKTLEEAIEFIFKTI